MKLTLLQFFGSMRILRRRLTEEGRPGLGVWADTGERAVRSVAGEVSTLAHKNECEEREVVSELVAVTQEGRITPAELRRLEKVVLPRLEECAEREHDIGEAVRT